MQANPELTPADIVEIIAATSTKPEPSMSYPNNTYGHGQIDAYAGLLYVLGTLNTIPTLSDHQPAAARFKLNGRMLNVEIDATKAARAELVVYDLSGAAVARATGCSINLSSLPSGVYAVQLNTNDKSTTGSTLIRL